MLHKYTNSQTHTNLQIYKYTDTVVLRPAKYVRGTKEADVRNSYIGETSLKHFCIASTSGVKEQYFVLVFCHYGIVIL